MYIYSGYYNINGLLFIDVSRVSDNLVHRHHQNKLIWGILAVITNSLEIKIKVAQKNN